MVFWRSAGAADGGIEGTVLSRFIGTVIAAPIVLGVSVSMGYRWAMTTCTNPSSGVTVASTLRPPVESGPERMAT